MAHALSDEMLGTSSGSPEEGVYKTCTLAVSSFMPSGGGGSWYSHASARLVMLLSASTNVAVTSPASVKYALWVPPERA
jgi:hypothetical protein